VNFGRKKKESYMSNDELKKKLHEKQTCRRNTERTLKYLKDKVENEMKTFVDDDHNDFLHMFRQVDRESLDVDMRIFWEAQEKAFGQKNPNAHRWHPRYLKCYIIILTYVRFKFIQLLHTMFNCSSFYARTCMELKQLMVANIKCTVAQIKYAFSFLYRVIRLCLSIWNRSPEAYIKKCLKVA
jgi:hypothetical protein